MSNLDKNIIACGADRRRRREKFRVLATKNQFFTIKNDKKLDSNPFGGGGHSSCCPPGCGPVSKAQAGSRPKLKHGLLGVVSLVLVLCLISYPSSKVISYSSEWHTQKPHKSTYFGYESAATNCHIPKMFATSVLSLLILLSIRNF